MESTVKACIINAAIGSWYPQGQRRLKESLIFHGFNWDILTWLDWPRNGFDKSCNYNVKASAFEEAIIRGYTHILWLDCSVWSVKDPNPIFDIINETGYYFWSNCYNCAQECSDKCLEYFGVDRDLAEQWPIASTSMFGVNITNPIGKQFIDEFIQSAKDAVFSGSRFHDNQSSDKRFLHHRQDQSAASIILNRLGCKIHEAGEYSAYYEPNKPQSETAIFLMRGM
jgi:hypothetical protein